MKYVRNNFSPYAYKLWRNVNIAIGKLNNPGHISH
jgi:hypothetical protein